METIKDPSTMFMVFSIPALVMFFYPPVAGAGDLITVFASLFFWWAKTRQIKLPLKMPSSAVKLKDPNNKGPGAGGKPEGILYLGNEKVSGQELWLSNGDARTHILYLGTTGAGKTEGLKSLVSNALTWGSGFIYVDGKADTDLWASLYALARRFGRDDDLLILNYMTGNADGGSASNSLNPFSSGGASYLTNLMVSLMDDAGGDNAMWKGRAISLLSALLPALTWKRDNQNLLMDVNVIREHLTLQAIIKISRDQAIPPKISRAMQGYLDTLPGFMPEAYDDEGREKPPAPDEPPRDLTVASQQHGYLSMQFTRTLQSLGDEYGYIFSSQLADIDMTDVVLNRRIMVALIPALEKSADEAANLGKIIAAALKGMMGATLGANVEGDWEGVIENKATRAPSPFLTVFDEVGYYTSQGMAVMAAQARSLGFSLIFAAQDLPAMEKRVKEEARSITANCNLKIFGKLEDSIDTAQFFEKTVGSAIVTEVSGYSMKPGSMSYYDSQNASVGSRAKSSLTELKKQKEGEVVMSFGDKVFAARMYYASPKKVKALRVLKMLCVKPDAPMSAKESSIIDTVLTKLRDPAWTAAKAAPPTLDNADLDALIKGFSLGTKQDKTLKESGALAVAMLGAKRIEQGGSLNPQDATPAAKAIEAAGMARKPMPPAMPQSGVAPRDGRSAPPPIAARPPLPPRPVSGAQPARPEENLKATTSRASKPSFLSKVDVGKQGRPFDVPSPGRWIDENMPSAPLIKDLETGKQMFILAEEDEQLLVRTGEILSQALFG
ncbi:MAG: type IV secretory system conjugative DNA transfer family protein [Alphaproteobacteria bacterium]